MNISLNETVLQISKILLYFSMQGYVTDVLDDAKVYSSYAGKREIDTEDVHLAVQCRMDQSFTTPPPRDVSLLLA